MSKRREIVRTRKHGWCDQEFAHPGEINPGDVVLVTTYMPTDEAVRDFGVPPWTRTRTCAWCVRRDMEDRHERERMKPALVVRWRELTGAAEPEGLEGSR
ncbi:hypothetical protein ACFVAJ_17250 [Agromyces sp. NPDC057679]|uniref:hypothetical protein n=1 Tax=Agromyces sp. NPDC057679 TaxID=3346207 RepID=UPI003671A616